MFVWPKVEVEVPFFVATLHKDGGRWQAVLPDFPQIRSVGRTAQAAALAAQRMLQEWVDQTRPADLPDPLPLDCLAPSARAVLLPAEIGKSIPMLTAVE